MPIPTFQPRKPFRRRISADAVGAEPAPPVEYVNVDYVIPWGGDANVAVWVFTLDVADPTGEEAAGLAIDGAAGESWEREDTNALRVAYPDEVLVGQPWTCAAGAAGIIGTEGEPLAAGAGEVNTPG
jgi:hypothetical protein